MVLNAGATALSLDRWYSWGMVVCPSAGSDARLAVFFGKIFCTIQLGARKKWNQNKYIWNQMQIFHTDSRVIKNFQSFHQYSELHLQGNSIFMFGFCLMCLFCYKVIHYLQSIHIYYGVKRFVSSFPSIYLMCIWRFAAS